MRIVNNFKNPCSTLAKRHQMKLAYLLCDDGAFLVQPSSMSTAVNVDLNYLSDEVVSALVSAGLSTDREVHQFKFAKLNGIAYYCGMYVVLDVPCDTPLFGRIEVIYTQGTKCYFLLVKSNSHYVIHISAYSVEVNATRNITACQPEDLFDYYPLSAYDMNERKYIVLQNFLTIITFSRTSPCSRSLSLTVLQCRSVTYVFVFSFLFQYINYVNVWILQGSNGGQITSSVWK